MAFKPAKKLPQFSDLVAVLARSKGIDDALYQTVQEIINRLDQFIIASGGIGGGSEGAQGPSGPPGPMPALDQTFITVNPEGSLANHRQLIAGSNITLNTATPNQIAISAAGGVSGGMEYLGDYVPGTYNDGDIVVASDGIAYVCTKNGTTTPPEPWPGGGIATSDGTYWTVTPHAGLANERALSSLANGYVKSTGGEPSTVAAIPPGDLPPFIAYTNVDNNFSVKQTLPEGSFIIGSSPHLYWSSPTSSAGNRHWRLIQYISDSVFRIEAMTDNFASVVATFNFSRNGTLAAAAFSGDGSNLTALNASNLATGLVATARLGSGTANSTTFLRGDQTWAVPPAAAGVVSGSVIFFTTPCPPGYTRVAIWDGYYVRMGPAHALGGANTHSHGVGTYTVAGHTHPAGTLSVPSHSHSSGSLAVDSHNHGSVSISGSTGGGGGHSHGYSGSISGTTGSSGSQMNVDAGASGNMSRGDHTHSFGANYSGETNSESNHTHTFSGSGGTGNASPGLSGNTSTQAAVTPTGSTGSAGAGISGASDVQNNMPLYIDFFACMKD